MGISTGGNFYKIPVLFRGNADVSNVVHGLRPGPFLNPPRALCLPLGVFLTPIDFQIPLRVFVDPLTCPTYRLVFPKPTEPPL